MKDLIAELNVLAKATFDAVYAIDRIYTYGTTESLPALSRKLMAAVEHAQLRLEYENARRGAGEKWQGACCGNHACCFKAELPGIGGNLER